MYKTKKNTRHLFTRQFPSCTSKSIEIQNNCAIDDLPKMSKVNNDLVFGQVVQNNKQIRRDKYNVNKTFIFDLLLLFSSLSLSRLKINNKKHEYHHFYKRNV